MENYTKICKVDELNEKVGKRFFLDDTDIAVFKIDGKIYAINNICPHYHVPVLHNGVVEGNTVLCPAHGWAFNLKDRKTENRKGVKTYPIKIIEKEVYIKVEKKNITWNF